jgi:hypothetical protein
VKQCWKRKLGIQSGVILKFDEPLKMPKKGIQQKKAVKAAIKVKAPARKAQSVKRMTTIVRHNPVRKTAQHQVVHVKPHHVKGPGSNPLAMVKARSDSSAAQYLQAQFDPERNAPAAYPDDDRYPTKVTASTLRADFGPITDSVNNKMYFGLVVLPKNDNMVYGMTASAGDAFTWSVFADDPNLSNFVASFIRTRTNALKIRIEGFGPYLDRGGRCYTGQISTEDITSAAFVPPANLSAVTAIQSLRLHDLAKDKSAALAVTWLPLDVSDHFFHDPNSSPTGNDFDLINSSALFIFGDLGLDTGVVGPNATFTAFITHHVEGICTNSSERFLDARTHEGNPDVVETLSDAAITAATSSTQPDSYEMNDSSWFTKAAKWITKSIPIVSDVVNGAESIWNGVSSIFGLLAVHRPGVTSPLLDAQTLHLIYAANFAVARRNWWKNMASFKDPIAEWNSILANIQRSTPSPYLTANPRLRYRLGSAQYNAVSTLLDSYGYDLRRVLAPSDPQALMIAYSKLLPATVVEEMKEDTSSLCEVKSVANKRK